MAKIARHLMVVKANRHEFEVLETVLGKQRHYVVDLQKLSCECYDWQLNGVPCSSMHFAE